MRIFIGFGLGLVFGIGLLLAQMTNPAKVIGFLDILDGWDPSLALVMASGLLVFGIGFWGLKNKRVTPLGLCVNLPKPGKIDARLIWGSVLFGLGWGLVGLCPGPALAAIFIGGASALVFVLSMVGGMVLFTAFEKMSK